MQLKFLYFFFEMVLSFLFLVYITHTCVETVFVDTLIYLVVTDDWIIFLAYFYINSFVFSKLLIYYI